MKTCTRLSERVGGMVDERLTEYTDTLVITKSFKNASNCPPVISQFLSTFFVYI